VVPEEVRELIRRMSRENPLWGAPRIHGELLKLGIEVGETSVGKVYGPPPEAALPDLRSYMYSWCWRMIAAGYFILASPLILRRSGQPSSCGKHFHRLRPKYLLRDRDRMFVAGFTKQVEDVGIQEMLSAPRSSWQRAYIERVIGSIRRECLDHMIVYNEASLYRLIKSFVAYYHETRTHLSLHKDAPMSRPVQPPGSGRVIALPQVGGLYHRYERRAA
jgi:transposase InsO family protein